MPLWTKPVTLVANTNENVNDLNAIVDDIYARANGGIDTTNLTDNGVGGVDLDPAGIPFPMRLIADRGGLVSGLTATAYALAVNQAANSVSMFSAVIPFDPADYAATGRTLRLRVRAFASPNAVAPGITIFAGMAPAVIATGASGSGNTVSTGTSVTGSVVTLTIGAAGSFTQTQSADFAAPAAGAYVMFVSSSGTQAVGSTVDVRTILQCHWI